MRLGEQNMMIQGAMLCNSASNLSVYGRLDHLETKKARAKNSERFKIKKIKNSFFVFSGMAFGWPHRKVLRILLPHHPGKLSGLCYSPCITPLAVTIVHATCTYKSFLQALFFFLPLILGRISGSDSVASGSQTAACLTACSTVRPPNSSPQR